MESQQLERKLQDTEENYLENKKPHSDDEEEEVFFTNIAADYTY